MQLDPASGLTRHFGRNSGLKGSEFNFAARLRSQSDRLLFGGTSGLVAFNPDQIKTNQHRPEIALGAFDRQGSLATRYSTGPNSDRLELDQINDLVTFQFAALDYSFDDVQVADGRLKIEFVYAVSLPCISGIVI